MATLKEKKPRTLPLKSDLVPVDAKSTKAACGSILGYTRNTPLRGLSVLSAARGFQGMTTTPPIWGTTSCTCTGSIWLRIVAKSKFLSACVFSISFSLYNVHSDKRSADDCSISVTSVAKVASASKHAEKNRIDQLFSHVPVLPQGMLKGQRQTHADQLLVNALTANLLPPSLMDSPEFREFLDFISNGTYIPPHRTKATESRYIAAPIESHGVR